MKLKGLTKLALSGVALAAVAATLGTSTYAWYVTNSTAKAGGASGKASATGSGNVLLAQNIYDGTATTSVNHGHTAFLPTITFNANNLTMDADGLVPVTPVAATYTITEDTALNANKTYYTRSGNAGAYVYTKVASPDVEDIESYYERTAEATATSITPETEWMDVNGKQKTTGNYLTFDLWLLSSEATSIKFDFEFVNTSNDNDINAQLAYSDSGAPVGYGNTFVKNIEGSLRMAYNQVNYTNTKTNTVSYTANSSTYDPEVTYYTGTPTADASVTSENFASKKANLYILADGKYQSVANASYDENATYYTATFAFAEIDEFEDGVTYYTRSATTTNNFDNGTSTGTTSFINVAESTSKLKSTAPNITEYSFATGACNAHTYYTAVTGGAPKYATEQFSDNASKAQQTISVTANQETKLTFYVWIEGTDTDCFDSIQGQKFEFNFKLSDVTNA